MRRWVMTVWLVATAGAAEEPPRAWVCVPPAAHAWSRCHKGSSAGEDQLRRCLEQEAAAPKRPARFRLNREEWVTFSPDAKKCVPAPAESSFTIEIEGIASWKQMISAKDCPSMTLEVVEPNFYGAVTTRCSKRP